MLPFDLKGCTLKFSSCKSEEYFVISSFSLELPPSALRLVKKPCIFVGSARKRNKRPNLEIMGKDYLG